MNIETIAFAAAGLALGAAVAIMIRAWLKSRGKRGRLATAYYDATRAAQTAGGPGGRSVMTPQAFASQVWPRLDAGGAGPAQAMTAAERSRLAMRVPVSPATYEPRRTEPLRPAYSSPSRPADPGPVAFGDPVPLGSSDPTPVTDTWDAFSREGGGGFGGAGASGGWDSPADNGGGYSGDSGDSGGSSVDSGGSSVDSSGGDSGGGSSND